MFSACDDDTLDYPDNKIIKGQWQLVDDGSKDLSVPSLKFPHP